MLITSPIDIESIRFILEVFRLSSKTIVNSEMCCVYIEGIYIFTPQKCYKIINKTTISCKK